MGARRLSWDPGWEQRVGDTVQMFYQLLYSHLEKGLRSFTQRLLKRDKWLWVFYAHLLVLYAIAASCLASTLYSVDPMGGGEAVHIRQASAASATVASTTALVIRTGKNE